MPTQTLLEVITEAYKKAGIVPDNATLSASKADKGKNDLNTLLGLWSAEGLLIYAGTLEYFTLVAGTASYTIGDGATFDSTRPEKILQWFIRDSSGNDYTDTEIWGKERYLNEPSKTTTGRPWGLWYNPTYPNGTIYLYPTPDAAESLYIYSEKPLSEIASLATSVTLPNEYLIALQTNLGVLLCAGKKQPSPDLVAWATTSKNAIQTKNLSTKMEKMSVGGFPGVEGRNRGTIFTVGA